MHTYAKIYDFAASAGAFEGFVYPKKELDPDDLPKWLDNLVGAYQHLDPEVRKEFQSLLDGTLGRAVRALIPVLGENHDTIRKIESMILGDLPKTSDDFQKTKWFQE